MQLCTQNVTKVFWMNPNPFPVSTHFPSHLLYPRPPVATYLCFPSTPPFLPFPIPPSPLNDGWLWFENYVDSLGGLKLQMMLTLVLDWSKLRIFGVLFTCGRRRGWGEGRSQNRQKVSSFRIAPESTDTDSGEWFRRGSDLGSFKYNVTPYPPPPLTPTWPKMYENFPEYVWDATFLLTPSPHNQVT